MSRLLVLTLLLCVPMFLVRTVRAADNVLTPDERVLLIDLDDAERAYVEFAVGHFEDGKIDLSNARTLATGNAGTLEHNRLKLQVLDASNMLATHDQDITVWIEGINTADLADDIGIDLRLTENQSLVVLGTKSYATVSGSQKTVKHLALVDTASLRPVLDRILSGRGYRTWSLGKHRKIRGRLKSSSGRFVEIETVNAESLKFAKHDLSADDRKYVVEELRRRAAARKAAQDAR